MMLGHGLEDGGQEGQSEHGGCLVLREGLAQRGDMAEAHPPEGTRRGGLGSSHASVNNSNKQMNQIW